MTRTITTIIICLALAAPAATSAAPPNANTSSGALTPATNTIRPTPQEARYAASTILGDLAEAMETALVVTPSKPLGTNARMSVARIEDVRYRVIVRRLGQRQLLVRIWRLPALPAVSGSARGTV